MNVFIRNYKDFYQWFATTPAVAGASAGTGTVASIEAEINQGSLEDLGEYYRQHDKILNWVLVAPTIDTANRVLHFSEKEKKHISKAIPFLLEEDLLTEATELHFVADKPAATEVSVVALDNDKLTTWLSELVSVGIKPTHCMPESKLLSNLTQESNVNWQIFYRHGEFIICQINGESAAFESDNFALSIELLTENYANLPASIVLIADDEAEIGYALTLVPESIKHLITTQTISYADLLQSQFVEKAKSWNLLKGRFAPSQQWVSLIAPWRWVILGLCLVLCVHMAMVASELFKYKTQQQKLSIELESQFRQAIPKGQMVDQRRQVESVLEKLQSGGPEGGFLQKMNKIGEVFSRHQVQTLNSLDYDKETGEFRIDLLVENYDKVQGVLNDIQNIGMATELLNSNAEGEQLRARIKIKGQTE